MYSNIYVFIVVVNDKKTENNDRKTLSQKKIEHRVLNMISFNGLFKEHKKSLILHIKAEDGRIFLYNLKDKDRVSVHIFIHLIKCLTTMKIRNLS